MLCCGFGFVYLRPVSCIPDVASLSRLSIRDWPFGFLYRLFSGQFYRCQEIFVKVNKRTSTYLTDVEYLFQLCIEKKTGYGIWGKKRSYIVIKLRAQSIEILKLRRDTFW